MSDRRLSIGILGLDPRARPYLEAVAGLEALEIHAVADRDRAMAERVGRRYGCTAFDDYRQFIVQNTFDALIVAEGTHLCVDYLRMAMRKKVHILKLPPMARGFEEAAELAAVAVAEQVRFDVACPLRYCEGPGRLAQWVGPGAQDRPFLVRVFCDVGIPSGEEEDRLGQLDSHLDWITHQELAGGGVLLYDCYGLVDGLIRALGVPAQVYCLSNSRASDKQQIHHLTEDNAIVAFKFGKDLIASLVAMRHWDDRPSREQVSLYGKDRIVTACPHETVICDSLGREIERQTYPYDPGAAVQQVMTYYALSFESPQCNPFTSDWRVNLDTMAVMEAAYLSARTGAPENPVRFLDISGLV